MQLYNENCMACTLVAFTRVAISHLYYNSQCHFVLIFAHNLTTQIALWPLYYKFWSYPQSETNGTSFV